MNAVMTQHIVMTAGVCGGKPRIDGTRIRVMDVVALSVHGNDSIDAILERFPTITHADAHAALAFYFDNIELIEAAFAEEERIVANFRASQTHKVLTLPDA